MTPLPIAVNVVCEWTLNSSFFWSIFANQNRYQGWHNIIKTGWARPQIPTPPSPGKTQFFSVHNFSLFLPQNFLISCKLTFLLKKYLWVLQFCGLFISPFLKKLGRRMPIQWRFPWEIKLGIWRIYTNCDGYPNICI